MTYEVVRSRACDRDLELIFDHLVETYQALGDSLSDALDRAGGRVRGIEDELDGLARHPFQATLRPDLMPNLRYVTKRQAVLYILIDETVAQVRVLAIFFGGQDHQRHMLRRLGR